MSGDGGKIQRARQARRMTQQQLADELGVHKSSVQNWEGGKHVPRNRLPVLEQVLGISLGGAPSDVDTPAVGSDDGDMPLPLTAVPDRQLIAERDRLTAELDRRLAAARAVTNGTDTDRGDDATPAPVASLPPETEGMEWAARRRRRPNRPDQQ